jgi:hypothetical protein
MSKEQYAAFCAEACKQWGVGADPELVKHFHGQYFSHCGSNNAS